VSGLVDAADGTICARYEYGPLGEPIRVSGPMAESNPIRFSTKYTDRESDLLYYGYRYYSPSTSRWLSRDPLEEAGAIALYSYVGNDAVGSFDFLGLKGAGHHIVPWSVFNGLVKEEVQAFFDSDLARIFNDYYKSHGAEKLQGISAKQYNHLVSEELEKFLGKQALREMTLEQAKQFLARITALPSEHPISVYNNAVRRRAAEAMKKALEKAAKRAAERSLKKVLAAGAKRGGAKLTKGIPLVGTVLVVYFYAQDAEAYGAVPAAVNSGIDAIPLVGTGKVIAEFYHRYTFLDVIVGKKNVQPSETDCAE